MNAAFTWQRDALAVATLARESAASGMERRVLLLRLSALPDELRREHHLRLLREALHPLLRPTRARLFELPSGDMVAAAPPPGEHLDLVAATMRRLLSDDTAVTEELRLPEQAAALLDLVAGALGLWAAPMELPAPATRGRPPTAAEVLGAEAALARADLEVHLRSQTVCTVAQGADGPEPLWQDHNLALGPLAEALLPGCDLSATPWLHRRLRSRAERRLLALWSRPEEVRGFNARGLSLLPASVLEDEFQRFDRLLPARARAQLTICFALADILADPGGFGLALRLLALRGYATALDGLGAAELPLLLPGLFGLDGLRLRFSRGWLELDAAAKAHLERCLPAERARVVLAGVEAPAAIGWGWERGITRFQGRLMEQRLSAGG
ncbi:MAG: hypothetical protein NTW56_18500 [Alphaproteobacteria bacterium]|nr:hypothetical protein [Alphaproteobacteria bacterium]